MCIDVGGSASLYGSDHSRPSTSAMPPFGVSDARSALAHNGWVMGGAMADPMAPGSKVGVLWRDVLMSVATVWAWLWPVPVSCHVLCVALCCAVWVALFVSSRCTGVAQPTPLVRSTSGGSWSSGLTQSSSGPSVTIYGFFYLLCHCVTLLVAYRLRLIILLPHRLQLTLFWRAVTAPGATTATLRRSGR
jgi:hypothetical protein